MIRKELKETFLQELNPSEKLLFLKKAKEAIQQKGYPVCEDLFHYCYFATLKERLRGITLQGGEGHVRFLLVEGRKNIEDAVKLYQERLEKKKLPRTDPTVHEFLDYFTQ